MKLVIFGCGNIAHRIAKGAKLVADCDLVGFASHDIDKAKTYAQTYGCKEYGDYDYFLNSDVDAVYIATYNINHYELIKECLNNHKHVICEKPMLPSIKENKEMYDLANKNQCILLEALKANYLPLMNKVKQMINNKEIGEVKYIEANFIRNGHHSDEHWINDLKTGGCLKDLGCYTVGIMNFLTDRKPTLIHSYKNDLTKGESFAEVNIDYEGIKAHSIVSHSVDGDSSLMVCGTDGYICVNNFWKTGKGYYVVNNQRYELDEEMINDFYYEIKYFTEIVDNNNITENIINEIISEYKLIITG